VKDGANSRAAGLALVRWMLGILFLFAGIGKMSGILGFVNGYLVPQFEKTFLPVALVRAYGLTLPFVELALGTLLILGVCRNMTLFVTGLTLLSLAFGQILIQGHAVVANIALYLLMTGALLYFGADDRWIVGPRDSASKST
jgi:thiosulfate dehydrogenase (quinone) large subunit